MSIKFKIPVKAVELRLDLTLQCGQSFRWFKVDSNKWRGVLGSEIWTLHQDKDHLYCDVKSITECQNDIKKNNLKSHQSELEKKIKAYLRLDTDLYALYKQWSLQDHNFSVISTDFQGIRMLYQDPVENVFSFICSSNNNIERITNLINSLCSEFGQFITSLYDRNFYSFPNPEALAVPGTEEKLRKLGFGYRAKYIENSAKLIVKNGGVEWLESLKKLDYRECHSEIVKLPGVGPKVADCICLMSMNHLEAIPVDTHVFQIAVRDYLPHLKEKKSVTSKVYDEIADHFRSVFGTYAGWAHSVLFTADLRKFRKTEKASKVTKGKKRPCAEV